MQTIVFIAKFPSDEDLKDGFFQRIAAVDLDFSNFKRIYIFLNEKNKFSKKTINPNLTIYNLNPLFHSKRIKEILTSSKLQYVHSMYNAIRLLPFLKYCSNLVLDVHGVVPEEELMCNHSIRSRILNFAEKIIFKSLKSAIVVSDSMKDYYSNKYPNLKGLNYKLKTIYPSNVVNAIVAQVDIENLKRELKINNETTVIIYSGNTQKWQNIDLMLQAIAKLDNPNYLFIILTQKREELSSLCNSICPGKNIIVKSESPENLGKYYSLSHYGFVLRDDNIVNRVAAPTKIIEYLNYGITPIVKSAEIGDWNKLGYEYISLEENLNILPPKKSYKNSELARNVYSKSQLTNLRELLASD